MPNDDAEVTERITQLLARAHPEWEVRYGPTVADAADDAPPHDRATQIHIALPDSDYWMRTDHFLAATRDRSHAALACIAAAIATNIRDTARLGTPTTREQVQAQLVLRCVPATTTYFVPFAIGVPGLDATLVIDGGSIMSLLTPAHVATLTATTGATVNECIAWGRTNLAAMGGTMTPRWHTELPIAVVDNATGYAGSLVLVPDVVRRWFAQRRCSGTLVAAPIHRDGIIFTTDRMLAERTCMPLLATMGVAMADQAIYPFLPPVDSAEGLHFPWLRLGAIPTYRSATAA